jgi:lipopolysaccharide export system permease protein
MPDFLVFTVPMSVMMAILLTFLRMASDNEIIAIKAGGGDVYHLVFPAFFFCLIGFIITFYMSVYGVAWGKNSFKKLEFEIASAGIDSVIKERTFNDEFDGFMFYVNKIDVKNKMFYDIFIHEDRNEKNKSTVVAPRGQRFVRKGDQSSVTLRLFDGVINRVNPEDNSVNTISFDTYDINIPLKKNSGKKKQSDVKERDEMTFSELRDYINDTNNEEPLRRAAAMELHERIALPFACFALGILAMPLGLKSAFSKKSSGLGLGLACFLMYYVLMGFGWSAGKGGFLSPLVGMWIPNIIMGGLGLFMLIRVAREKTIGLEFVFNYIVMAYEKLKRVLNRK